MNSDLDRTYDPYARNEEFEDWLDEMDRLSDPERIEAERIYWERKQAVLEEKFDFQRENPKEEF